jgi:hypothetical protein
MTLHARWYANLTKSDSGRVEGEDKTHPSVDEMIDARIILTRDPRVHATGDGKCNGRVE